MGIPNKINPLTGGDILPRGYIKVKGIKFNNTIHLTVNVTDSRKPTEMASEFCVIEQPVDWLSQLGYFDDSSQCYNRVGVSHRNYVTVADSNKIYYRKQSGANIITYMQELILHKWYDFHAFADGKIMLNNELYHYEDVGNQLFQYGKIYFNHLPYIERFNGHQSFSYDGKLQFDLYPCITPAGIVTFFDKVKNEVLSLDQPIAYMTVSQARYLRKLPIVASGALTVSLPWEAQYDTGVQNALSIAAARGWTITVQYRDPEVATTSIPIGFLESTGTQYIDAGLRYSTSDTYSQTLDLSITDKNHYGHTGVNYLGWCSVKNGTYYMLTEIPNTPIGERAIIYNKFLNGEMFLYVNDSEVSRSTQTATVSNVIAGIFALGNLNNTWWNTSQNIKAKLYSAKFTKNDVLARDMLPALDSTGAPCLYDLVTKQTFYNDGTGAFIAGFNTIEQSMKLATLPDVTAETDTTKKSLTVSLPWEAQWDTGVQNALQVAADRGWTITVQYRDPEVTTTPMPIGFLESTGTQWIDTNYIPSNDDGLLTDVETLINGDRLFMGSRNSASTETRFYAHRYSDLATKGYGWGAWSVFWSAPSFVGRITTKLNFLNSRVVGSEYAETSLSTLPFSPEYPIYIFATNIAGVPSLIWGGRIWRAQISNKSTIAMDFRPTIDKEGVPCMYDRITKQLFYNIGTGAFIAGFDTVAQARNLAHLPDVTAETDAAKKSLTVSLPWEAQLVITGVPAALQVAADRGWTITVQYRDPEADNAYYNKYAACTTTAEVAAVNADYQNDLTADGEWIYPLPELEDGEYLFYEVKNLHIFNMTLPKLKKANQMFGYSGLVKISIVAPLLEDATTLIYSLNSLEEVYFELPVCTNYNYFMPGAGKARRVIGSFALCKTAAAAFNINRSLEEIDARFPALEGGTRLFDGCQLKKQFALDCLNSIPSYTSGTHNIMLGIHVDYQNDEEVLTAITNAESKGWTVTVQWNGTATAAAASVATFGLRTPSIYAKLGTSEHPDGTTENILDWGHYVTNWEENGYQEFSSVEEAEEYFNINQPEEL